MTRKLRGWWGERKRHSDAAKKGKRKPRQFIREWPGQEPWRTDKMLDLIYGLSPADLYVFENNLPVFYRNKAIEMATEMGFLDEIGTQTLSGAFPRAHRHRVSRLRRMILSLDEKSLLNLKRNLPIKFQRKLEVEGF